MDPKLLELAEKSTLDVETNQRRFYSEIDGYKFNNRNLTRWYQKENNCWAPYIDSQLPLIKSNLDNTTFDPSVNYNLRFIKKLKDEYKEVKLLFSGGYDSLQIFYDFVENDIPIDEVIINTGLDIEPEISDEIMMNCEPLLKQYKGLIKKTTVVQYTYEQINDRWKGDWSLFDRPSGEVVPPVPTNIGIGNALDIDPDACYIKGTDKPQLIMYNDKWYVTAIENNLGTHYEIPNLIYFWWDAGNIMSLIKDARAYRDYLVKNNHVSSGLQFFFFYNQDELNSVIGRREIPRPDVKLAKQDKRQIRFSRLLEAGKYETLFHFSNSLRKYQEIFPGTHGDMATHRHSLGDSKFAWFIDIDNMEAFSQHELIPKGF